MKKFLLLVSALLFTSMVNAKDLKPYSGEPLPGFTLSDMSGKQHSLSQYQGKVLMVNFWATYCGPCIKEMPSMQRLKEKLADKPFDILAINMAEEKSDIEAFLRRHKIEVNFPILLDTEGAVIEQWMVSAVPTTFIIDTEGKIQYALYGGLEWDNADVLTTISGLLK